MTAFLRIFASTLAFATFCIGAQAPATGASAALPELIIKEISPGSGTGAVDGQVLNVHYTGWLYDITLPENKGKKFDSSRDRNATFPVTLGARRVIRGWEQGLLGVKVGGRRLLVIPPHLAYGERGAAGVIPPGATLLFDVEVVSMGPAPAAAAAGAPMK